MKYIIMILYLYVAGGLFAKGVAAGTVIQNSASLSYMVEGKNHTTSSNVVKSVVEQVIDTTVSWMDTRDVIVNAGETKSILTYQVKNEGNGKDRFNLVSEVLVNKSDFVPTKVKVYLDINKDLRFDSNDRERKTVTLEADETQFVFIVSDIPADDSISSKSLSYLNLKALSRTGGSGERGKIHSGKGINNVDALDGLSGGIDEDEGAYKLLIANVNIDKNVTIDDNDLITVRLNISVSGDGSVKDVNIIDVIPDETKYVSGSLLLDGGTLTDSDDSDAGRYKRKYEERKAEIQMSLGELDTSSHHTIVYNLTIR